MRSVGLASLALLVLAIPCPARAQCADFTIEVVAPSLPGRNQRTAIALAPDGEPVVCGPPVFARRTASGWTPQALPQGFDWNVSLTTDDTNVFAAFSRLHNFVFAQQTSNGWSEQEIAVAFAPRLQSVTVDPQGRRHCVMLSSASGGIYVGLVHYAWSEGGPWVTTLVDERSDTFTTEKLCQVGVGKTGAPHLLVENHYMNLIRYWQGPTFGEGEVVGTGEHSALALDEKDDAFVSFYDPTSQSLELAVRADAWNAVTVDDQGDPGRYSSLAIDQQGGFHIVYYAAENSELRYAHRGPDANDPWSICTIDSSSDPADEVGKDCILALDDNDDLHVAYTGRSQMWYATTRAPVAVRHTTLGALKSRYR